MNTPIPINIITGFLGAGKTTTILALLDRRPSTERWAILVNEFGEIGIDGALMRGEQGRADGVFILEVPGGCMCCTAGISMSLTLSEIIFLVQPDRILIEPTGLGHPNEVMQTLHHEAFREHLLIQRTLTLIDPRSLSQSHVVNHPSFLQQLDMADVVIVSKPDLCDRDQMAELEEYVDARCGPKIPLIPISFGKLSLDMLDAPTSWRHHGEPTSAPINASAETFIEKTLPETGILVARNEGDDFETIGWRVSADKCFQYRELLSFFYSLDVERMKAVVITDEGVFAYNLSGGILKEIAIDDCLESRLEIICQSISSNWDTALMGCLIS